MTPGRLIVCTEHVVKGNLWQLFPVINVDRVKDIPADYPGAMGVPITFLDKHDSKQFEILDLTKSGVRLESGREPYRRIIIRNLRPCLPEYIDLADWLERCGAAYYCGEAFRCCAACPLSCSMRCGWLPEEKETSEGT